MSDPPPHALDRLVRSTFTRFAVPLLGQLLQRSVLSYEPIESQAHFVAEVRTDLVLRVRFAEEPQPVILPIEFQAAPDPQLPERLLLAALSQHRQDP